MSDLISMEAAIAYAISGRTRWYEGEKWIRVSEVRESLKTMPSEQPEQQWIPVSERLPDKAQFVIATVDVDGMRLTETRWYSLAHGFEILESGERVVAWQPLPKPYQGGAE